MVDWDNNRILLPTVKEAAIRDKTPVLRWDYVCAGVHNMVANDDDSFASGDDDDEYDAPKRWGRCPNGVKLRVSQGFSILWCNCAETVLGRSQR